MEIKKIPLSPREQEIYKLILQGYDNPEIANKLALSKATVDTHITSIRNKYNCCSKIELLANRIQELENDNDVDYYRQKINDLAYLINNLQIENEKLKERILGLNV